MCASLVSVCAVVDAQTVDGGAPSVAEVVAAPDPARLAYDEGLRSLAERRFHDAAVALERSARMRPLPVVTYNLALAYRGLGRYVAAIDAFEAYLRAPDAAAPPERLAAIREEVSDLRAQLVRVVARVDPPDAEVVVDGRAAGAVVADTGLTLDPGPHVLAWSATGHRTERREIPGVAGSQVQLDVRLEPLREGRLVVDPTPATTRVTVDGRPMGTGPVSVALPPGEHWVELHADGRVSQRRPVQVGFTGTVRLAVALEAQPLPRWVVPTAIAGAVLVVGGIVAVALAVGLPTVPDPAHGSWGDVHEP